MSSIVVAGDTSGSITLQAPAVAGSTVLTLPAQTGTVMVNGPAFSAGLAGSQTLTAGILTKLIWDIEEYDTNNNFASNRFTPTIAGYYQINVSVYTSTASTNQSLYIYKNGIAYKQICYQPGATQWLMWGGSLLVYCNGSSDYIEIYMSMQTGGILGNNAGTTYNYFQAFLARSA